MARRSLVPLLVGTLLLGLAPGSGAQNFRWLQDSPVRFFTDEDWALLKSTVSKALENDDEGETLGWSNEATGASGTITGLERSELDGKPCRRVKFFNSANGFTGSGHHRLCKAADGNWMLATQ